MSLPPVAPPKPVVRLRVPLVQKTEAVPVGGDWIERLRAVDWFQFEKIVALACEKQGYGVQRRGGANPDGGIDMVIERHGIQRAVQCKQWTGWKLQEKTVRELVGAMAIAKIPHGVFAILDGCTLPARSLAQECNIEILDEKNLTKMLEATGAIFDPDLHALLDDKRKCCPKCENQMVLRTTRKGPNAGREFWGCSTYPKCSYQFHISDDGTPFDGAEH